MSIELQATSNKTGSVEKIASSDNRIDTSARVDSRSYYSSRDNSQAFSLVFDDASSEAGDYIVYWKNTDVTGKILVIDSCGLNSENAASFKLSVVTGTAVGSSVTPTCLNVAFKQSAQAACIEAAGTAITGLAEESVVDHAATGAGCHEEFRLDDRLRIGQDQAIAIEYEQGTTGRAWGVIFGYYE